jgi:hypothetical protein
LRRAAYDIAVIARDRKGKTLPRMNLMTQIKDQ